MLRWCAVTALAVAFNVAAPAWGAPIDDALAAYAGGNYAAAMTVAKPLAEAGDARAQTLVGRMIHLGQGTVSDDPLAQVWFLKAARQGNAEAQLATAKLYELGEGINQNMGEAYAWAATAAQLGLADAVTYRDTVATYISGTELAQAKRDAAKYWDDYGAPFKK